MGRGAGNAQLESLTSVEANTETAPTGSGTQKSVQKLGSGKGQTNLITYFLILVTYPSYRGQFYLV